jgi:hypothetical protein
MDCSRMAVYALNWSCGMSQKIGMSAFDMVMMTASIFRYSKCNP